MFWLGSYRFLFFFWEGAGGWKVSFVFFLMFFCSVHFEWAGNGGGVGSLLTGGPATNDNPRVVTNLVAPSHPLSLLGL